MGYYTDFTLESNADDLCIDFITDDSCCLSDLLNDGEINQGLF